MAIPEHLAADRTKIFDIPLGHLDFKYIEKCSNVKEVEKILKCLRSHEEGCYPDLEHFCEKKLSEISPNSRMLRKSTPAKTARDIDGDDLVKITDNLRNWMTDIKTADENLRYISSAGKHDNFPPIRGSNIDNNSLLNDEDVGIVISTVKNNHVNAGKVKENKPVKPRDYHDWDKFDIDKELENVDNKADKQQQKSVKSGSISSLPPPTLDGKDMTSTEREAKAAMEKNKGNEAFYAGDYDESIVYYNRSLSLCNMLATYNNRAMAYIKLKKLDFALEDCNTVLETETKNVKAMLRRAVVNQGLTNYEKALEDVQEVLEWEPHNQRAQTLLVEIQEEISAISSKKNINGTNILVKEGDHLPAKPTRKGRRMVIEEVENDEEFSSLMNGHVDIRNTTNIRDSKTCLSNNNKESCGKYENKSDALNANDAQTFDSSSSIISLQNIKINIKNDGENKHVERESSDTASDSMATESENISETVSHESESEADDEGMPVLDIEEKKSPSANEENDSDKRPILDQEEMPEPQATSKKKQAKNVRKSKVLAALKLNSDDIEKTPASIAKLQVVVQNDVQQKQMLMHVSELPDSIVFLKAGGNELFRTGQYAEAIERYDKAIFKLEAVKDVDHRVNLSRLYSNRAACKLKTGASRECINDCTKAIALVPHSFKPLLRRAQAYESLEKYKQAYVDYKHVLAIDTSVDVAQVGTTRCGQHLNSELGRDWRQELPPIPMVRLIDVPLIFEPKSPGTTDSSNQQSKTDIKENLSPLKTDNPPQKTDEELYLVYKEQGNKHVQKGDYKKAVECYTACIKLFPHRTVPYTNRALCYLRLNQPDLVISDCDKALEIEPNNVKAFFRRAQAKRILKNYLTCLDDLSKLLKIDPKNAAAKRELDDVKKLYREELNTTKTCKSTAETDVECTKLANKRRKRVVIEEINGSDDERVLSENEVKLEFKRTSVNKNKEYNSKKQTKKQIVVEKLLKKSEHVSKIVEISSTVEERDTCSNSVHNMPSKITLSSKSSKKKRKKGTSVSEEQSTAKQSNVPHLTKMTPYEFMHAWNSLKSSSGIELYSQLLQQIRASDLPKILSNKLDGDMLTIIIKCVHKYATQDVQRAYDLLDHLAKVSRFQMVAMFLSLDDKKLIREITLKFPAKCDVVALKRAYGLKV